MIQCACRRLISASMVRSSAHATLLQCRADRHPPEPKMERAGRLISKLKIPKEVLEPEALARTAWPVAVGRKIAAHARPVRLVRSTLVVECEDSVWQNHLYTLSSQIVRNLQSILGPQVVTGLDFRPAVPRRGPQVAVAVRQEAAPMVAPEADEADSIADPVFRHLYKRARKNQMGLDFEAAPEPLGPFKQKVSA